MLEGAGGAGTQTFDSEWLREQHALWPWIGRFLWSPAADLHPSRHDQLLPGWSREAWSDPAVRAHVSRHLLSVHGLLDEPRSDTVWHGSGGGDFLVALLPQAPLARLARYLGLALHGAAAGEASGALDEAERAFIQRAPLYWHKPAVCANEPDATGWHALRILVGGQPAEVTRRFEWKMPVSLPDPVPDAGPAALLTLTRKILKEFEEPWSSLFATLRRPDCQIRLHG